MNITQMDDIADKQMVDEYGTHCEFWNTQKWTNKLIYQNKQNVYMYLFNTCTKYWYRILVIFVDHYFP